MPAIRKWIATSLTLIALAAAPHGAVGAETPLPTPTPSPTPTPLPEFPVAAHGAVPDSDRLQTTALQAAIDAAAQAGGGIVRIPRGRFRSGGLRLRSNIHLILEQGAILEGSVNPQDYGEGVWVDALLTGQDLQNITIEGPGTIDGADCKNPRGEEGFRGPHAIFLSRCKNIAIRNVTITRAGNYAILCRNCADAHIRNVSIRGGHDGLHAQACQRFTIRDCDFRTGDDCFAGCDNTDFKITGCQINSSCNGFRLGCVNLLVQDCKIWGPGEYVHQVSLRRGEGAPRTNMLSAFVHFAPTDRDPQLPSDNWLIKDCKIDNVDFVYGYDIERGLWQTGQPAKRLRFENIQARQVTRPIRVLGDAERQFDLTLDNVSIAFHPDHTDQEILNLNRFGALTLRNVTLQNSGQKPVLRARDGGLVRLEGVTCIPKNAEPFVLENVDKIETSS